ncbi:5703_t:CDS:10 [Racocetra persica]|uniref:5703_t:CDS:1 n=1 Tax=Racocetra persica TaxID=160502 RepID=A0ACA9M3S5_9GLOM|nr:5703_t:CDS:10 [Racocetra persica]
MAEAISEMQKLVKEASDIKYISGASLKTYFRSANALLRQANRYKEENDLINAYKFYMRYATLALEKLPNHPEYKKSEHKAGKVELSKNSQIVLGEIEKLKPILQEHFRHSAEKELIIKDVSLSSIESQKDQTQEYNNKDYHNDENDQNREYDDQNDYQNKSYQSQGLQNQIPESSLDLVEQLKNINLHSTSPEITKPEEQLHPKVYYPNVSERNRSDGYHYSAHTPRAVSSQALSFYDAPLSDFPPSVESSQALSSQVIPSPVLSRQIPPSIVPSPVLSRHITPPALPPKVRNEAPLLPPKPNGYSVEELVSNKHDHFKAIKDYGLQPEYQAYTEGGEGLRKVYLPDDIYEIFVKVASKNTEKNLETCGILFGSLSHNVFYVTTLIIPKQTATSDTCEVTNEEDLIEYEEKGLMILGWIHTHPTQTCFMSSMDLHTHSSFQVISPEAIAIVCAPKKYPNFGIFRLTNPPGLQKVLECTLRGFHPHECDEPIDREITENGHIIMKRMALDVIDLHMVFCHFVIRRCVSCDDMSLNGRRKRRRRAVRRRNDIWDACRV